MSALFLDERIVHYEVLGRGRPVIFLHGWVDSWRYWLQAMQTTSVSFRAYALDLWGFGNTSRDPERYTLEQQATLLESFLQRLGIAKVALIGHGLGGHPSCSPTISPKRLIVSCSWIARWISLPSTPGWKQLLPLT